MPRKKKIAEPVIEAPSTGVGATPNESPEALVASSEARIDPETEHRKGAKVPAPDVAAEAEAQALDTFEEAFDSAEPLGDAVEDLARSEEAENKAQKKPKSPRKPRKIKEPAHEDVAAKDTEEAEAPADSAVVPVTAGTPSLGDVDLAGAENETESEGKFASEPAPPAKLERLQKILSQAGVASRRHAEELIAEGRVQVNGKIVTELGTKADPERDHIRVDGKLLRGAERLRYFVLNKPRGYVTTVSDPEGRPTVMAFFAKAAERLYPVGRLDYQSEGLLLVTNDGDLANKLTKAASGVEKTYLVKVSGRPTEEELDQLREGVNIDRAKPGEGRVKTAPSTIRQVRQGDNPWFEVVLIEGRNRELRKMFEEIGHYVEKIRRVGYGPLVLDQEPGKFRELEAGELAQLRLAADGKWRRPKGPEAQRGRGSERARPADRGEGRRSEPRYERKAEDKRRPDRFVRETPPRRTGAREGGWERRPPTGPQPEWQRGARSVPPQGRSDEGRSEGSRSFGRKPPAGFSGRKPPTGFGGRSPRGPGQAGPRRPESGTAESKRDGASRPAWERGARGDRGFGPGRREARETRGRVSRFRDEGGRADRERPRSTAPRPQRPAPFRSEEGRSERPRFERPDAGRRGFGGSKPRPQGTSGARPGQKPDWKKKPGGTNRPAVEGRTRSNSGPGGPSRSAGRASGGRGPGARPGRGGPGRSHGGPRGGQGRGGDQRGGRGKRF